MGSTHLPHGAAVDAFATRLEELSLPAVQRVLLFGSVATDSHTGASDVDVLVVVDDHADEPAVADRVRDIAYDVMLEHGVAFSVHPMSESTLQRRSDHPFFQTVLSEGQSVYG